MVKYDLGGSTYRKRFDVIGEKIGVVRPNSSVGKIIIYLIYAPGRKINHLFWEEIITPLIKLNKT